jgi:hypothetical protein
MAHYRYEILGNSWSAMPPVPVNIYGPAAAAVGTYTYLVGGGNPSLGVSQAGKDSVAASLRAPTISYASTYLYDTLNKLEKNMKTKLLGLFAISLSLMSAIEASSTTIVPLNQENGIFAVSNVAGTVGGRPSIAFDGTNFFAVFMDDPQHDVFGSFISQDGTVLNPQGLRITPNSIGIFEPSVAFDGTNYMVIWTGEVEGTSDTDIYGARVSPNGTVLDPVPIRITNGANPKYKPNGIAFDGTNFLIAWRSQGDAITVARITTSGINLEGDTGIYLGQGFYPWVAFNGTNYLVVWHYWGNGLDIFGSLVGTDGTVLPPGVITISSESNDQDHASVASNGTEFFVSWHDWNGTDNYGNGSAHATRVSAQGTVLDVPSLKVADHTLWQVPVVSIYDGSNYFVVWHVNSYINFRGGDIYARRIASDGTFVDEVPFSITASIDNSFGPTAAYGNGRYLVTWAGNVFVASSRTAMAQVLEVGNSPGSPPVSPVQNTVQPTTNNPWEIHSGALPQPYRIWGFDDNNFYATGENGNIYRYDEVGTQWTFLFNIEHGRQFGLWGNGPNDLWVVGWCWNIDYWTPENNHNLSCWDSGVAMATWGSSSANVYSIGAFGEYTDLQYFRFGQPYYYWLSFQYNGQVVYSDQGPTNVHADLFGIWGTGPNNVYAVGEVGTIIRYNGISFSKLPNIPTYQSLNAIWGTNAHNIFVVGDNGVILHFDGVSWTQQFSGTTENLSGVWGFSNSSVYAVGAYGTILHYDGTNWSPEESGVSNEFLVSVAGAGNTVRVVSEIGTVLTKTEKDCVGTITPTNVSIDHYTHTGSVTVNASPACSWTADSNYPWITVTSGNVGNGNGTVTFSVAPNVEFSWRGGSITIAGQTFTVIQDQYYPPEPRSKPTPRPRPVPHSRP